jgi:formylglycine-generating enzyme required for sulfatase activity
VEWGGALKSYNNLWWQIVSFENLYEPFRRVCLLKGKMFKTTIIVIFIAVLLVSWSGLAQQGKSLSVADIEELLKSGVTPKRVAQLVSERGVNFAMSGAINERLKNAGADVNVLVEVGKAADKYVSTKPTPEQGKAEPTQPKPMETKKPPEPKVVTAPPPPPPPPAQSSRDGAEMVSVPAGQFWMGSDHGDADEKPRRRVYLDAFRIDKYEVTNALYRRFMDASGRAAPQYWNDSKWNEPNQPVVGVDWNDASVYCAWAGKRLPTEAEWEKAARGTDGRKYPWGEQWDSSRVNSDESNLGKTVAVGSYPSGVSPYGAHDMAGNVREWVADWYADSYYQRAPDRNPKGPESGQYRVLRGGSWDGDPWFLRSSFRGRGVPTYRFHFIGVRCAQ